MARKTTREALGLHGFGGARRRRAAWRLIGWGRSSESCAMFEQDWLDVGMAGEQADQFRAAIAAEADDADAL